MGWIIGSLISGLIVGAIARLLTPGKDRMGCLMTSLVGIAGSFVGGFIAQLLWKETGNFQPAGFGLSLVGAILVLLLLRMFRGRD